MNALLIDEDIETNNHDNNKVNTGLIPIEIDSCDNNDNFNDDDDINSNGNNHLYGCISKLMHRHWLPECDWTYNKNNNNSYQEYNTISTTSYVHDDNEHIDEQYDNDDQEQLQFGNNNTGSVVILNPNLIKFFKFYWITIAMIVFMWGFVRITNQNYDATYDLSSKFVMYDLQPITLDVITFYIVSRLHVSRAIDTAEFVLPGVFVAILQSLGATYIANLKHSITLYEMQCEWGKSMYVLVFGVCVPVLVLIIGKHIQESRIRRIGYQKCIELVFTILIYILPFIGNPFFHLHHWYYSWIVGMHCNLDGWTNNINNNNNDNNNSNRRKNNNYDHCNPSSSSSSSSSSCWWSRLCMSIFWGIYINGVGIFGRDPVMTCAITLYQSQSQKCPYITLVDHINTTKSSLVDVVTPATATISTVEEYDQECCTMGYGNYTLEDLSYDINFYNHILNGGRSDDHDHRTGRCST